MAAAPGYWPRWRATAVAAAMALPGAIYTVEIATHPDV